MVLANISVLPVQCFSSYPSYQIPTKSKQSGLQIEKSNKYLTISRNYELKILKVSAKFSEIILQCFDQKVKYHILQSYKNK